jgi:hypothetical protein
MVLSTPEKLASQNPAVRREGQRELSQQAPSSQSQTISKATQITHSGFSGVTSARTVIRESASTIEVGQIPPSPNFTSITGQQLFIQPSITPPSPAPPTPTVEISILPQNMGKITAVSHRFGGGVFGRDEIFVTVSVRNTSTTTQEYRAYLYTSSGDRVDKEPDLSWRNVKAGQTTTFQVSSAGPKFDVNSFGGAYRISIESQGGIFIDERIVSLITGDIRDPRDREQGSLQDPDTAPPIIPPSDDTFVSKTPPFEEEKVVKDRLFDSLSDYLKVGGGALALIFVVYLVTKK